MRTKRHTLILALIVGMLPSVVRAQNIAEIAKSDPLVISGAVGTQNTYHYTTGSTYASPLSNTLFATLNISVYGFSMPFSLYYSNNNLEFNYPHLSFNLNPSYKNWTGHFGESSMPFSNYIMNMSFNGVGLEYNDGKRFRGGIFYGRLKKAINDDPTNPLARSPQYKRMGWGFKVGYGSGKNYLDLYLLRAYDCLNSLDESWHSRVKPKENIVVGAKGCITPAKWMSLTANFATSVFSTDTEADKVPIKTDFDKVFDVRYSSLMRFAGDANLNLMFKGWTANMSYRLVQPDYTSLGTYYLSNNYHSLGLTLSGSLFHKISLSGTFSGQADNLTKEQLYTTCGFVYGANASTTIGKVNIVAGYNGYMQTQWDGMVAVNDTTQIRRTMNSYMISPSYSIDGNTLGHTISLSANYVTNKDLNRFATGQSDVQTLAAGASYSMDVKPWEISIGASYSHQQTNGYKTRYTSDVLSFNTSRSFLEEKNLNVAANVNWAYNHVLYQSKSLSMGGSLSASYNLKKYHLFSASASVNRYGDVNINHTQSNLNMTDISASLNYTYTLPVYTLKKRSKKI